MTYSRQIIKINTKINDEKLIKTMIQSVLKFSEKHDVDEYLEEKLNEGQWLSDFHF